MDVPFLLNVRLVIGSMHKQELKMLNYLSNGVKRAWDCAEPSTVIR